MSDLDIRPLRDDLNFGARVRGVTRENIDAFRKELEDVYWRAGVVVFEDVEQSGEMQVAISNIAGPLKDHLQKTVARVDQDSLPGVIVIRSEPEQKARIEIDGKAKAHWLPWHFDHCYNNELNRGSVLRSVEVPPEGGMTGFLDCIGLYDTFPAELLERIESRSILYRMNVIMDNFHFGRPERYKVLAESKSSYAVMDEMAPVPRAIHPAVWTRKTGEKVLHVSPWMAEGIEGAEDPEGDALLDAVCREIFAAREHIYFHKWHTTEMVLWDNWRMLHAASGHDPKHGRTMQRTTIFGDYGLGRFEQGGVKARMVDLVDMV